MYIPTLGINSLYWIIFGGFMLLSYLVSTILQAKFKKYAKEPLASGMTGREVALKMLADHGITDVTVHQSNGFLSDHYNPTNKTLNLSPDVYSRCSVSAAAVAAHECGHAVQHARAYQWLTLRSRLVPVVQFGSRWSQWIIMIGLMLLFIDALAGFSKTIILVGIVLFALTTLFAFITLPVEYNASSRALAWLETADITDRRQHKHAADALRWAARTYVVGAIASLGTLLYYIYIFMDRR